MKVVESLPELRRDPSAPPSNMLWIPGGTSHMGSDNHYPEEAPPMLERLAYLRTNSFKSFIVSGGGIDFMRPWTEKVYGIPPEQVVGSSAITRFEIGRLAKALDEGRKRGWAITDMKRDWRVIFPNEPTTSGSRQP